VKQPVEIPDLSSLVFDASRHEGINYPEGDFWVFAYGSLMWDPGFDFLRNETAQLYGYHRCLCLWSVEYRGTLERPGLVMGLDHGGSCLGRAFLISEKNAPQIIAQLNEREMITGAYRSALKPLHLGTDELVEGICLIARRDHPQYAPSLPRQTIIELVKGAHGKRGSNREYVLNTVHHLQEMGMVDDILANIALLLEQ
jgi:cation transport protein ChaC